VAATALFGPVAGDIDHVERELAEVARVEYPVLAALLEHLLETRGKRVRPALVYLSAGFYDYPLDRLTKLGAAIELLHTATLVHDDLVDEAATRRGIATLQTLVSERATVLVGDYLFARSAALCTETENVRVMRVFGDTLATICDGELRQIFSHGELKTSLDDYYRRIISKTASLLRTATETGAILSNAPEWAVRALRDYGENVGIAFQIVDDVLDFAGDEGRLGKPVGNDLRQRIVTLPTLWLLENRPDERAVRDVFAATEPEEEEDAVSRAVSAVLDSPAIGYSLDVARDHCARARAAIDGLPDTPHRRTLLNLTDYVLERQS
jgi:geranylgeranyl pyrophosphate synthase